MTSWDLGAFDGVSAFGSLSEQRVPSSDVGSGIGTKEIQFTEEHLATKKAAKKAKGASQAKKLSRAKKMKEVKPLIIAHSFGGGSQ